MSNKTVIPSYAKDYKREYQFIKGLDDLFGDLRKKKMQNGLFACKKAERVKDLIKKYFRGREKGKLKRTNIKDYSLKKDLDNIIYFYIILIEYSQHYNIKSNEYGDEAKPYPGIRDFYDTFFRFFGEIEEEYYDSDSDSDFEIILEYSDSESDREIVLEYSDSD